MTDAATPREGCSGARGGFGDPGARGAPSGTPIGAMALCALGAAAVGLSPLLVRAADVGPAASAFWRAGTALPLLALWAWWELRRGAAPLTLREKTIAWSAGLLFAGDLAFWHLAIHHTSLANASFLVVSLPLALVPLGAWAFLGIRSTARFGLAFALAMIGAGLLIGASVALDPAHLRGDVEAMITAVFFAAYVLVLGLIGAGRPAGAVAAHATLATAVGLLLVYPLSGETAFWPGGGGDWWAGWMSVLALGVLCQAIGQGAIVSALRTLAPSVAAILLLVEPLTTVLSGWAILGEGLSGAQIAGAGFTVAAIAMARERAA